ncbi:MAG: hypothetical protein D6736_13985, partial [Nitrospinota bacterium]
LLLAYPLALSQARPLRVLALAALSLFLVTLLLWRRFFLFFLNGLLLTMMFSATLPWGRHTIDLYGAALYGLLLYLFWELGAFYTRYHPYQLHPRFTRQYLLYLCGSGGGFLLLTLLLGMAIMGGEGLVHGLIYPLLMAIGSTLGLLGVLFWLILSRV